jgi:hypothetical protein
MTDAHVEGLLGRRWIGQRRRKSPDMCASGALRYSMPLVCAVAWAGESDKGNSNFWPYGAGRRARSAMRYYGAMRYGKHMRVGGSGGADVACR